MKLTRLISLTNATLVSLLVLGVYSTAAAQRATPRQVPTARPQPAHPTAGRETRPAGGPKTEAKEVKSFRGIATKLGMTPEELEDAYKAAQQANPKLTRGQFIAAHVLAQNLGDKNPNITTQAILDGLQSGKSIGQTLESLGLSSSEAKEAERATDREIKEARKHAQAEGKEASETKPDQDKPDNR